MGLVQRFNDWRQARRFDRVTSSAEYAAAFEQRLAARYDATQTTADNERHWANSDGLGPNAANTAAVRKKVRQRARYEALENNSYAKGMVLGFSNQLIGTGPRLQLSTKDKAANQRVEKSFHRWAEEIGLAEKLRTMAMAYVVDGEAFALLTTNERLEHSVKLDIVPHECDYFEPSYTKAGDSVDGATFDKSNNPLTWYKWPEYPGESLTFLNSINPEAVDAADVLHVHRPDRPGQRRGMSHLVTALPLFSMYRRFKLATLAAAETAADYSAVMYTTGSAAAAIPADSLHWGQVVPIQHRSMLTLPEGWDMKQFSPEHPQSTLEMFETRIIAEVARCLLQPLNVALGSSKAEIDLVELASKSKTIVAITNKDGRTECHAAAMTAKDARVSIEKAGKAAREDATAFSKAVIAEERRQGHQRRHEDQQGQQHHVAHVARPGGADEDAVHLEGEHAADRGEGRPGQVSGSGGTDVLGSGDQRHQVPAEEQQQHRRNARERKSPERGQVDGAGDAHHR